MKRLFVATAIAMFAIPALADHAGGPAIRGLGPTSPIGSHDLGGTDPRHVTDHRYDEASVGSGSPYGVVAPSSGPTSHIGSHDVGGTDPRHAVYGSGRSDVTGAESTALSTQWGGPTDPTGSP